MAYWLVKSEPSAYAWGQFVAESPTAWTGVRNYQARLQLMAMEVGDEVLYYHSNEGKEIVGTACVVRGHYPDPTAEPTGGKEWMVVDLAAQEPLARPVTLVQIKADPILRDMALVRQSRLSVMPIKREEWDRVLELSIGKVE